MERGEGGARKIGDFLPSVMKEMGPKRRDELYELSEAWCRAAGPEVAKRTRVIGMNRETLTVGVESAGLKMELESFRRDTILERLKTEYPAKRIAGLKCLLR